MIKTRQIDGLIQQALIVELYFKVGLHICSSVHLSLGSTTNTTSRPATDIRCLDEVPSIPFLFSPTKQTRSTSESFNTGGCINAYIYIGINWLYYHQYYTSACSLCVLTCCPWVAILILTCPDVRSKPTITYYAHDGRTFIHIYAWIYYYMNRGQIVCCQDRPRRKGSEEK